MKKLRDLLRWLAGLPPQAVVDSVNEAYQQEKALFESDVKMCETKKNRIISELRLPERFSDDGAR